MVIDGLSFEVRAGEALSVSGPNGSGKSTLLRLLAGLVELDRGSFVLKGSTLEDPASLRQELVYLGHADAVKDSLDVRQNVTVQAGLLGGSGSIDRALGTFGLDPIHDLPARYLSSGQRRRVALCRLVTCARPLWLLDEPAVGLDRANRQTLETLVTGHLDRGGAVVLASHGDLVIAGAHGLSLGR